MIRACDDADVEAIYTIINDAAQAYRGIISADRWHEPYMPRQELRDEITAGVAFLGYEDAGELVGVMGVQPVKDVTLIRYAYVRTLKRRGGIGAALLRECLARTDCGRNSCNGGSSKRIVTGRSSTAPAKSSG